MAGLDKWLYNFAKRRKLPTLGLTGTTQTVGATEVEVLLRDSSDRVLLCRGTSVPTGAGYAKGCIFLKTDAGGGSSGIYDNQGTVSSASFQVVTGSTGVTTDLSTVTSKITSEQLLRSIGDSVATSKVTSTGTKAETDDSAVASKLTSEVTDRSIDESVLQSAIDSGALRASVLESKVASYHA